MSETSSVGAQGDDEENTVACDPVELPQPSIGTLPAVLEALERESKRNHDGVVFRMLTDVSVAVAVAV